MKKIHKIAVVLLSVILLFTAGCSKPADNPDMPPENVTTEPTVATEATERTEATEQTEPAPNDASLVSLRQAMVETPQVFAVAYFGHPESVDPDTQPDPFAIMKTYAYWLCEDLPFLMGIPQDRIVGETGELYCIVPKDENATVTVNRESWDDNGDALTEVLYRSESGDPILLFCNGGGWEPDTEVVITDSDGTVTTWYPQLDDNKCVMPLQNDNGEDLFFVFSSYREFLMAKHSNMKDTEWVMPTAEMLAGSEWKWSGYLKDGREVSYRLIFEESVLSVIWNDGIDEMDHEYLYAPWELTYDEGFAILSIDFQEMAGIVRYNLLYHEASEQMYVGMDAVQEEMPIGWEPLYRILSRSEAPEVVELVGTWELAWTEIEGDRSEAEPGSCRITIMSAAAGGLLLSYTSREFPQNNIDCELLTIDMREMYYGCGNDAWVADLDYVGPYDTTYTVTLTADGILIKQNYFLVDGAPMVSYEFFRRVAE